MKSFPNEEKKQIAQPDWLEKLVVLMDSAVRIPGTNIRIGLDAVIGLVPGLGETVSYVISGALLLAMIQRGASLSTALQMVLNITLDYLMGSVPVLGDLVDVGFKANERNLALLRQQPVTQKPKLPPFGIMLAVAVLLVIILVVMIFLIWKALGWLWGAIGLA